MFLLIYQLIIFFIPLFSFLHSIYFGNIKTCNVDCNETFINVLCQVLFKNLCVFLFSENVTCLFFLTDLEIYVEKYFVKFNNFKFTKGFSFIFAIS